MPGPKKIYQDKRLFEQVAREVHGDKYDYSKFALFNSTTPGTVICKQCHHEFRVKPWDHLYGGKKRAGYGCPRCANKQRGQTLNKNTQWFLNELRLRRVDKGEYYDYSKVIYISAHDNIEIGCPIHGPFWQTPDSHLRGSGCPICSHYYDEGEKLRAWNNYFNKMKQIRPDKCEYYDYSHVVYENCNVPVEIRCPTHGSFWQSPAQHLHANGKCPVCSGSNLERLVQQILTEYNIKFEREKTFAFLKRQRLDFYLPDYNIAFECQGEQHYKPVPYFNRNGNTLEVIQKNDRTKRNRCANNGIKVYYIKYTEKNIKEKIQKILTKQNKSTPNLL